MNYFIRGLYIILLIWCIESTIFCFNGFIYMMNQLYKNRKYDKGEIINCLCYFAIACSISAFAAVTIWNSFL